MNESIAHTKIDEWKGKGVRVTLSLVEGPEIYDEATLLYVKTVIEWPLVNKVEACKK